MKIIKYHRTYDIRVEFLDKHGFEMNTTYGNFLKGQIKNPYDKSVFKAGYLGVGKYMAKQNNKLTEAYVSWKHILERCYDEPQKHKHPAYYGICTVCEEWLNFQNYAEWFYANFDKNAYDGRIHIDKDILHKGNKIYAPEHCTFIPQRINMMFMEKEKHTDKDLPNAIFRCVNGFRAAYNAKSLGVFKTLEEAIIAHADERRIHIREIADEYKDIIPPRLYDALYRW